VRGQCSAGKSCASSAGGGSCAGGAADKAGRGWERREACVSARIKRREIAAPCAPAPAQSAPGHADNGAAPRGSATGRAERWRAEERQRTDASSGKRTAGRAPAAAPRRRRAASSAACAAAERAGSTCSGERVRERRMRRERPRGTHAPGDACARRRRTLAGGTPRTLRAPASQGGSVNVRGAGELSRFGPSCADATTPRGASRLAATRRRALPRR
jgi:hypothetical protein